ncbi:imidazole glycerol phosphate synthase subunit HisH [archaeon SCG-AAA382B04]|nr:imidazole glycerol phosphate synthase subunit HisH [archaeon SCG-AAA382B04]
MAKIAIIDYGLGNLRSVKKAIEKTTAKTEITDNNEKIRKADGIIIPGVGAFEDGIKNLSKYREEIYRAFENDKPVLGICLGMQLTLTKGYEGNKELKGLDIIQGEVISLPTQKKVPHIGWNSIKLTQNHPLLKGIGNGDYFYFVHSYYTNTASERDVLAECRYGINFPAVISRKNYVGVQFHPEKSGKKGIQLLKNFVEYCKS